MELRETPNGVSWPGRQASTLETGALFPQALHPAKPSPPPPGNYPHSWPTLFVHFCCALSRRSPEEISWGGMRGKGLLLSCFLRRRTSSPPLTHKNTNTTTRYLICARFT